MRDPLGAPRPSVNDRRSPPLTTAYVTAAACSGVAVFYTVYEVEPSPLVVLIVQLAPLLAVIIWLQDDARLTKAVNVYDWGFLLWVAWPLLMPWYVVKTRGRRGWLLAFKLTALMFAPFIVASAVSLLWWALEYFASYWRSGA